MILPTNRGRINIYSIFGQTRLEILEKPMLNRKSKHDVLLKKFVYNVHFSKYDVELRVIPF